MGKLSGALSKNTTISNNKYTYSHFWRAQFEIELYNIIIIIIVVIAPNDIRSTTE